MKKKLFVFACLCLSLLPLKSQTKAPAFWKELENPINAVSPNADFFFDAIVGRSGRVYAYVMSVENCLGCYKNPMILTSESIVDGVADWKECPYFTLNEIVGWQSDKRFYSWDVSLDDKLYVCQGFRLYELSDPFGQGRVLLDLNESQRKSEDFFMPESALAVHKASDGTLFLISSHKIYKSTGNYDTFEPIFSFEHPYDLEFLSRYVYIYIGSNYDRTQSYAIVNFSPYPVYKTRIYDLTAEKELPLYPSNYSTDLLNKPVVDDDGNLYFNDWVIDYSNGEMLKYIVMYDSKEKVYRKRQIGCSYYQYEPVFKEGISPHSFLIDRDGYIYLSGRDDDAFNGWNSSECGGLWIGKLGDADWMDLPFAPVKEDKSIYGDLYSAMFLGIDKAGYYYMMINNTINKNGGHLCVSASPYPNVPEWTSVMPMATSKMEVYVDGDEFVINSPEDPLVGEIGVYNMSGVRVACTEGSTSECVRLKSGHLPRGIYLIGATGISGKRLTAKIAL